MDVMQVFKDALTKLGETIFVPPPTLPFELMREHLDQTMENYRETNDLRLLSEHRKHIRALASQGEELGTSKRIGKENKVPTDKEAVQASENPERKTTGRPRRKAYQIASNRLAEELLPPNNMSPIIKEERITDAGDKAEKGGSNEVELPPPKQPVKRGRKKVIKEEGAVSRVTRSTRSKRLDSGQDVDALGRSTRTTRAAAKMSDVSEIPTELETIEVPDDRSETIKRVRSPAPSPMTKSGRPKRTKAKKSPEKPKASLASVYEDARDSQSSNTPHAEDFLTPAATPLVSNKTFVVQQPTVVLTRISKEKLKEIEEAARNSTAANTVPVTAASSVVLEQLLTDDESMTEDNLPQPKTAGKTTVGTPVMDSRHLAVASSSKKKNALADSIAVTLSNFKQTRQMLQERQQQRKEKEEKAIKKREALLQKQSEDKRRKRLEKEMKVKQQKETFEKAKQRLVEQQKDKEEKVKQMHLDKQERLIKQREESEKRRLIAKQKAEEIRREEERKKAEEAELLRKQAEDAERQQLKQAVRKMVRVAQVPSTEPRYVREKAPLLPTPDCYDTDDESKPSVQLPSWNQKEAMKRSLHTMQYIDLKLRNTLFSSKAQTPNLQKLFPNLDPHKLRRKSSAVWKQAPRFTMISSFE